MDQTFTKDRLRLLLDHFSAVGDPREACKVKYPLREVLFLVTCASIAGCDDDDEIADWGDAHHDFPKGYGEYFFGTPKEDWLPTFDLYGPLFGIFSSEECFAGVLAFAANLRAPGARCQLRKGRHDVCAP